MLGAMSVVLSPLVLHGELPRATDTTAFYAPFAAFLHDQLAHGTLPLWNPTAFAGQPFAADAQSGVLYPPALAAYWLLSASSGLVALAIFHYALAALGTYAFARVVGAGRLGAAYAGIAYGASGHLVARAETLGLLAGLGWLPVCMTAAELCARTRPERRPAAVVLLGACLAGSLLAGSQQLAAVTAIAAGLWLWTRAGRRGVVLALAAVGAAVLFSAVALLPRLELLHRSSSADGVADPDGIGSLLWGDRRALYGPYGVSHSELTTLYLGALTPVLALYALAAVRRRRWPLATLVAFAIVWATGLAGWLLGPVPLIRSLATHEPVRAMAVALLALAVLAGLAVSRMTTRRPSIVLLLACALALLVLGGGTPWHEAFLLPLAAGGLCLPLLGGGRRTLALGAVLLLAVVTLDLHWHAGHQTVPLAWRSASSVLPAPAASAQFLLDRQAAGAFRFATVGDTYSLRHQLGGAGGASARQLLLDSESVRLGLEDVAGYNPVHLKTYTAYMRASNGGETVDRHFEFALRGPTPQLRALGVRYYVSRAGTQPKGLPVVFRQGLAVITRDPQALPVARTVRRDGSVQPAQIVERAADRVEIESGGAAGRLVLADPQYPGWQVAVDGHAAHAETADGLFRAVELPAGRHRVVWTFEPRSLQIGLWVSIASLVVLGGGSLAWPAVRRRRRARPPRAM